MSITTLDQPRQRGKVTVVKQYDVAADAKKRISLQGAVTKYFHVLALSNGAFMLEPRVLVPPHAVSARSMKMLEKSAANLKKAIVSPSIDLTPFPED